MRRASIRNLVVAAFAASLPALPSFAGNLSLMIDGIGGSIEVLAFNFGARNQGSIASGGGSGAGKVSFTEFTFSATESAASPSLFEYVNQGKHTPSARFTVNNPDTGKLHSEWVLTDVLVTSFSVTNGDLDPKAKLPNTFGAPVTAFGLSFAKACYRVFAGDGSVAKESCWNVATNSTT